MTVAVDAVVYYRVSNATISVTNVEDANRSTRLLAQTTLRNVLGTKNLSEILSDREQISNSMQVKILALQGMFALTGSSYVTHEFILQNVWIIVSYKFLTIQHMNRNSISREYRFIPQSLYTVYVRRMLSGNKLNLNEPRAWW